MNKIFNQTNLLEGGNMLVPWKFLIIYRYNPAVDAEQATVSGFGITKDNQKVSLFAPYTLDWQPEQLEANSWLTGVVLAVKQMNLINVWIEIDGIEYIDLDRIDMVVRSIAGLAGVAVDGIDPGGPT